MNCIKAATIMSQGLVVLRKRLENLSAGTGMLVLLAGAAIWIALDIVFQGAMREQRTWIMLGVSNPNYSYVQTVMNRLRFSLWIWIVSRKSMTR